MKSMAINVFFRIELIFIVDIGFRALLTALFNWIGPPHKLPKKQEEEESISLPFQYNVPHPIGEWKMIFYFFFPHGKYHLGHCYHNLIDFGVRYISSLIHFPIYSFHKKKKKCFDLTR